MLETSWNVELWSNKVLHDFINSIVVSGYRVLFMVSHARGLFILNGIRRLPETYITWKLRYCQNFTLSLWKNCIVIYWVEKTSKSCLLRTCWSSFYATHSFFDGIIFPSVSNIVRRISRDPLVSASYGIL